MLFSMYLYCPLSLPLRCDHPSDVIIPVIDPTLVGFPPHIVISHSLSFSPSLSIYLYLSLHRPYSFDIPLRPWPKCVPEQEQPIAVACPLTAPVTQVHARDELQPVHKVVPRRPDPDHRVVDLDKSSGDRNWDNGTSVWIHGAKSPHRGDRKVGHAKCFTPC